MSIRLRLDPMKNPCKPFSGNLGEKLKELSFYFQHHPKVLLAYLFGSSASGERKRESDIDIAVYAPQLSLWEQGILWEEAARIMGTERLDIVSLNNVSPLFKFEVIKGGKLLYCRDTEILNHFELRAWQEYQDTEYLRRVTTEYLQEKLKHGL